MTILERSDMGRRGDAGARSAGLAELLPVLLGRLAHLRLARAVLAQSHGGLVDELAQLLELVALADATGADLLALDDRLQVSLEAVDRSRDPERHEDPDRDRQRQQHPEG